MQRKARGVILLLTAALVACQPGQYPVDIFNEMHYQPSKRRLEPDRATPPEDAVPITGGSPVYTYPQAAGLENPIVRNPATLQRASALYQTNCAMCHGPQGRGDGPVAAYFARGYAVPPTDLASTRVRNRPDGGLYWIITYGLASMPPYEDLLSQADVWALVHFIREMQTGSAR